MADWDKIFKKYQKKGIKSQAQEQELQRLQGVPRDKWSPLDTTNWETLTGVKLRQENKSEEPAPTPSRFNPVISKTQSQIEALVNEAKSRGYSVEKGMVVLNKPKLDDYQGEENPFEAHKKAVEEYKKKSKFSPRIKTIQKKLNRLKSELKASEKLYQAEYSDSLKTGTPIKKKDSLGLFK